MITNYGFKHVSTLGRTGLEGPGLAGFDLSEPLPPPLPSPLRGGKGRAGMGMGEVQRRRFTAARSISMKLYTRFRHLSKGWFTASGREGGEKWGCGGRFCRPPHSHSSPPSTETNGPGVAPGLLAIPPYGCGGGPTPGGIVSPSGRLRRYSHETKRTSSHTCPSAVNVSMSRIQRFSPFSSR